MNIPETASANAPDYPKEFWLRTLLRWYIGLIIRPSPTIREIVDRRPVWVGVGTVLLVGVTNGVIRSGLGLDTEGLQSFTGQEITSVLVWFFISAILVTLVLAIGVVFWSAIGHLVSGLVGGSGAYIGLLAGLMIASVLTLIILLPSMLGILVMATGQAAGDEIVLLEMIGLLSIIAVAIWSMVLGVILIRENYRISTGAAIIAGSTSAIAGMTVQFGLLVGLIVVVLGSIGS